MSSLLNKPLQKNPVTNINANKHPTRSNVLDISSTESNSKPNKASKSTKPYSDVTFTDNYDVSLCYVL